jgi:hypothetical protein
MPWLKIEHETPEKPEVIAIASMLNLSPDETFGVIFRMWRWFDTHTRDGNARSVTSALLDKLLGVTGFAEAVISVGWLLVTDNGLQLPNFERHNGQTSKERALTAKRVARCKSTGNGKGNAPVTVDALPREREEKNIGGVPPITPQRTRERRKTLVDSEIMNVLEIPSELTGDAPRQAIRDWLEHKDRIRDQYASPKSFQVELRRWAKLGADRFCAAVAYSIGKEWQGIYEEQARHGPASRAGSAEPCRTAAEVAKRNRAEREAFLKQALEVDG